jgi:hypothetical protein
MPSNTAAELLIRITADPSSAEAAIERFRARFGRDFSALGLELDSWSRQSSGQLAGVNRSTQQLSDHFRLQTNLINQLLDRNRERASLWRSDLTASFAAVGNASGALYARLNRNFLEFDSALGANITSATVWQKSIGDAFRKAALAAVAALAQEAVVRAIYSTALGFYLLAIQDYRGAALAFKSAAIFGGVGGAAALAGRALAAPEPRETERGTTARSAAAESPASPAQAVQTPPQKTVQVIFQGPVYGGQAGIDELVRHISQVVEERDVNLVAYTVVRQPATRA